MSGTDMSMWEFLMWGLRPKKMHARARANMVREWGQEAALYVVDGTQHYDHIAACLDTLDPSEHRAFTDAYRDTLAHAEITGAMHSQQVLRRMNQLAAAVHNHRTTTR